MLNPKVPMLAHKIKVSQVLKKTCQKCPQDKHRAQETTEKRLQTSQLCPAPCKWAPKHHDRPDTLKWAPNWTNGHSQALLTRQVNCVESRCLSPASYFFFLLRCWITEHPPQHPIFTEMMMMFCSEKIPLACFFFLSFFSFLLLLLLRACGPFPVFLLSFILPVFLLLLRRLSARATI